MKTQRIKQKLVRDREKLLHFVAGASLLQGQVHISWQAQHFRKVRYRFRIRRSTFARYGIDFASGAALRGRHSTFERSGAHFAAGAALSKGTVHISRQAQHFRKVKYRFHGRRSTFPRSGTEFVAGAALSHRSRCSTFASCDGRRSTFAAGLGGGGPPP